jgi:hypothetical protein
VDATAREGGLEMNDKFKTIFLQRFEEDEDLSDDTTWCYDQIHEYDVEYIKISDYKQLEQQNKELKDQKKELELELKQATEELQEFVWGENNPQEYKSLYQQNKELVELVYKCRGMQYARSSAECSLIWEDVEKKLQEIKGE